MQRRCLQSRHTQAHMLAEAECHNDEVTAAGSQLHGTDWEQQRRVPDIHREIAGACAQRYCIVVSHGNGPIAMHRCIIVSYDLISFRWSAKPSRLQTTSAWLQTSVSCRNEQQPPLMHIQQVGIP